jgi:membrane-bound serine protease (ClpP class)
MGGLAAFVFGSIILMDTDVPGYAVSRTLIGGIATVGGLASLGLVYMFVRARKRPVVSGRESMIGQLAEAINDFSGPGPLRGNVFIEGERWLAESLVPVAKGKSVRVLAMHGLVLDVEPEVD